MKTAREIIAGALDGETIGDGRKDTFERAIDAILAALAAEGFSIVETGRDPNLWSLETDDDTLICRSGTKSITIRAETATVFDVASDEAAKVVPVSALSRSTRGEKT